MELFIIFFLNKIIIKMSKILNMKSSHITQSHSIRCYICNDASFDFI